MNGSLLSHLDSRRILRPLIQKEENDDLTKVKKLSHQLQLSTKRLSVLQWKRIVEEKRRNGLLGEAVLSESPNFLKNFDSENLPVDDGELMVVVNGKNSMPQMMSVHKNANCFKLNASKTLHNASAEIKENAQRPDHKGKNHSSFTKEANRPGSTKTLKEESESEKRRKVNDALNNIRKDLMLMRLEDHSLARKLLDIRQSMNRRKASLICDEHAEMLDNFTWEIEEEKELDEKHKVSDLSSALLRRPDSLLRSPSMLHHMGISKMTFDFRRFSVV